jgi:hypothetical protein
LAPFTLILLTSFKALSFKGKSSTPISRIFMSTAVRRFGAGFHYGLARNRKLRA